jgi:parvulin-like peptidyl-prolyl isomerase
VSTRLSKLAAALLTAVAVACGATPAGEDEPKAPAAAPVPRELPAIVARVGDEAIERWEVEAAVREITVSALHPVPQGERDELVRTILDRLVEHHLAAQIARTRGVAATDAEVDDDLKEMRREQPGGQAFEQGLGITAEQLRHQRRLSLDMAKLMRAASPGPVPEAAIAAYYRDNRERFLLPEAVTASHILIRVFPDSTAEQREVARRRASDILNQILGGADFARTARDQSEDAHTALSGGLLGTFPRGQMPPSFDAAAFSIKPGEISALVETPLGFHIIRVDEHAAGRMQTVDDVRGDIRTLLTDRAQQEVLDKLIEEARRTAKIEIYI